MVIPPCLSKRDKAVSPPVCAFVRRPSVSQSVRVVRGVDPSDEHFWTRCAAATQQDTLDVMSDEMKNNDDSCNCWFSNADTRIMSNRTCPESRSPTSSYGSFDMADEFEPNVTSAG
ncbi:unnamed protein product [Cylicostephanus goldi]|uniref:Uncharacterized protein n=1 Tax=Cylicostephanus goldi TaxID=71465 RepID=A0A3P6TR41_CYLGO|nr:unnamed protein product [Cylicostephanus goldi]